MENHCFADLSALEKRAEILQKIRSYFTQENVLEIETPILAPAASVDLYLDSFETHFVQNESKTPQFLQTSPEFHMKRFLSKHKRDCYQITKAFRNGEMGKRHNPEFSILEWYRVGMTYFELMDDVSKLVQQVCQRSDFSKVTYSELFLSKLKIDVHTITLQELQEIVSKEIPNFMIDTLDEGFDLLLTHKIEAKLAKKGCVFVYDYPASQAALAKLSPKDKRVSCRFELYIDGVEICNGFEELSDAAEQEMRFKENLENRKKIDKPIYPYDRKLLHALEHGFPNSSGVAIGLDRLIMAALGKEKIKDVMAFTQENA